MPEQQMPEGQAGGMEGIEPGGQEQSGYEICIKVGADGQMSIGVEQAKAEVAEGAAEGQEGAYTPVQGMQDLMKQIAMILQSKGQMPDRADEQAGFEQGFSGQ
jgi:hypothetical protein